MSDDGIERAADAYDAHLAELTEHYWQDQLRLRYRHRLTGKWRVVYRKSLRLVVGWQRLRLQKRKISLEEATLLLANSEEDSLETGYIAYTLAKEGRPLEQVLAGCYLPLTNAERRSVLWLLDAFAVVEGGTNG